MKINTLYAPFYPSNSSLLHSLILSFEDVWGSRFWSRLKRPTVSEQLILFQRLIRYFEVKTVILYEAEQGSIPQKAKMTSKFFDFLLALMQSTDCIWIFQFEVEEAYEDMFDYLKLYGQSIEIRNDASK